MSASVVCGKCGKTITNMRVLRSLRDTMSPTRGKCPACGERLSSSEFEIDAQEK